MKLPDLDAILALEESRQAFHASRPDGHWLLLQPVHQDDCEALKTTSTDLQELDEINFKSVNGSNRISYI